MPNEFKFRIAQLADAVDVTKFVNETYHGPEAAQSWTPETHLHSGPRTSIAEIASYFRNPACRIVLRKELG